MNVTIKICGLTNPDDARTAVDVGADFLGFLFSPVSPRCVGGATAAWIGLIEGARKVGVFRDQDPGLIRRVREEAGLDLVQLHGHEPPELCAELGGREKVIKAIPVDEGTDWGLVAAYGQAARVLFDTGSPSGGGTGRRLDWSLLTGVSPGLAFWLAGGLTPENVARALAEVRPAGVDVATGVEAAVGRKDAGKMKAFIAAVRGSIGRREGVQV